MGVAVGKVSTVLNKPLEATVTNSNGGRSGRHQKQFSSLRPFPFEPSRMKRWGLALRKEVAASLDLSEHETFEMTLNGDFPGAPLSLVLLFPSRHRVVAENGDPASFVYADWLLPPGTNREDVVLFYRGGHIDIDIGCEHQTGLIVGSAKFIYSYLPIVVEASSKLPPNEGLSISASTPERREEGYLRVDLVETGSSVLRVEYRSWTEGFLAHGGELYASGEGQPLTQ